MSNVNDGVKSLMKALEADMYGGTTDHKVKQNLCRLLHKLKIKSASPYSGIFTMESLESVMKHVTYSFGQPSSIIMSPDSLKALNKLHGKRK